MLLLIKAGEIEDVAYGQIYIGTLALLNNVPQCALSYTSVATEG